jgi:hypothetical protein
VLFALAPVEPAETVFAGLTTQFAPCAKAAVGLKTVNPSHATETAVQADRTFRAQKIASKNFMMPPNGG